MTATPSQPDVVQAIESYGPNRFRISGIDYTGSVIVLPDSTRSWSAADMTEVSLDRLQDVIAASPPVEILLIGCGPKLLPVPQSLRSGLREHGIGVDAMDTGAACRTFNVLSSEMRRVAAALIALPEDA